MRISHSAIKEYNDCGKKYKLNRVDRLRSVEKSSAFVFGSAIDEAFESILLKKKDYLKKFKEMMVKTDIHGKEHITRNSHLIKYFAKDLQLELLSEGTLLEIDTEACDILNLQKFDIEEFVAYVKKCKGKVSKEEKTVFNIINYESVLVKGEMILEKLKEWCEENIKEVHDIQKKLSTTNEEGDELMGYVDFIATFNDGVKRIVDLKTASDPKRQYPDDCIESSQQLTIYSEIEGIEQVAYLIVDKGIRKKDPRVRIRYVQGNIHPQAADDIFDNIESSLEKIKQGVFKANLDFCHAYGGCPYRDFCKSDGQNKKGLINLHKKEIK